MLVQTEDQDYLVAKYSDAKNSIAVQALSEEENNDLEENKGALLKPDQKILSL